jgi:uncharacterized protein (TIGR02145 family)
MQTKHLFLLPALAFIACAGLQAQVTIGGLTNPAAGALLDLNSPGGAKGGLVLSNVSLPDLTTIPFNSEGAFPGVTSENKETVKAQFKGAIVYHTGENGIPAGVYVWNGEKWIPAGGAPANIVEDAQGNEYSIAKFGDAGWWMTQNLRSTQYDDGTGETLTAGASTIVTDKRYDYPGESTKNRDDRKAALEANDSLLLKAYGLLYNWAAASGRTDSYDDSYGSTPGYGTFQPTIGQYYQGICPKGWHLPSDWEWSQLEKEIATNPKKYSSQETPYAYLSDGVFFNTSFVYRPGQSGNDTYWGRQMKSTVPVVTSIPTNGSSKPRNEDGFVALLVGYVLSTGGVEGYGSYVVFWSSSSSTNSAVDRFLEYNTTGVGRGNGYKDRLFSVRCKKNNQL